MMFFWSLVIIATNILTSGLFLLPGGEMMAVDRAALSVTRGCAPLTSQREVLGHWCAPFSSHSVSWKQIRSKKKMDSWDCIVVCVHVYSTENFTEARRSFIREEEN